MNKIIIIVAIVATVNASNDDNRTVIVKQLDYRNMKIAQRDTRTIIRDNKLIVRDKLVSR